MVVFIFFKFSFWNMKLQIMKALKAVIKKNEHQCAEDNRSVIPTSQNNSPLSWTTLGISFH